MTIIVDSGSTKTDWIFLTKNGREIHKNSMGFNPVFHSSESITRATQKLIDDDICSDDKGSIYYYGSGCWDEQRKQIVRDGLQAVFKHYKINVCHDLLGAARATCGQTEGIACILGTGSNSCLFDGQEVVDNVTSIGYMLGDEGSASHLGKKLIRHYFYREIPKDLITDLEAFIGGGKKEVLEKTYGNEHPNVYLASLARFLSQHLEHPFIQRILYRSLSEFIDRHVRKYDGHMRLPIHFVGSIACVFQEMLQIILAERNMIPGRFIKKPIDELKKYHLNK